MKLTITLCSLLCSFFYIFASNEPLNTSEIWSEEGQLQSIMPAFDRLVMGEEDLDDFEQVRCFLEAVNVTGSQLFCDTVTCRADHVGRYWREWSDVKQTRRETLYVATHRKDFQSLVMMMNDYLEFLERARNLAKAHHCTGSFLSDEGLSLRGQSLLYANDESWMFRGHQDVRCETEDWLVTISGDIGDITEGPDFD